MKIKSFKLKNWAITLFAIFLIFTISVSFDIFSSADSKTTEFLQSLIPDILTTPFSIFSVLGTAEVTAILLLLILLLFSNIKKIYIFTAFVVLGVIEILGKTFIHQVSPPAEILRTNISLGFPSSSVIPHKIFYSYPSGHSARTAFITAILLILIWESSMRKELKYIFVFCILIFDLIMFLSRVYLGEHWVSDVIGGALLGFSLASIVIYALSKKADTNKT